MCMMFFATLDFSFLWFSYNFLHGPGFLSVPGILSSPLFALAKSQTYVIIVPVGADAATVPLSLRASAAMKASPCPASTVPFHLVP